MKKNYFIHFIFCLLAVFFFGAFVVAQENAGSADKNGNDSEEARDKGEESAKDNVIKQNITVTPSVIDETFLESEMGKYKIKLKNNTDRKFDIYATVNNVNPKTGKLEFETVNSKERKTSAANWIRIKRGVIELMPGEEASVPLDIKVAMDAKPGKYYASVSFPYGSNRKMAENSMKNKSFTELRVNIDIKENVIEKARVKKFITPRNLFLSREINFKIDLENFGNKAIDPHGSIYIFNRNGAEVAEIEISKGEHKLGPGQISEIEKTWKNDFGSGKYKAKLELEYGEDSARDLQDTLFFWFLSWKMLLTFLSLTVLLVSLSTYFIFRKTYHG